MTKKRTDPMKPGLRTTEGLYTAVAGAVTATVALLTSLGVLRPDSVPAAAEARWAMISTAVLTGAYADGRSLLKAAQTRHGSTAAEIEGIVTQAIEAALPAALAGVRVAAGETAYTLHLNATDHERLAAQIVDGIAAGRATPQRVAVEHPAPTLVAPDVPQTGHSDHSGVRGDHAHTDETVG